MTEIWTSSVNRLFFDWVDMQFVIFHICSNTVNKKQELVSKTALKLQCVHICIIICHYLLCCMASFFCAAIFLIQTHRFPLRLLSVHSHCVDYTIDQMQCKENVCQRFRDAEPNNVEDIFNTQNEPGGGFCLI